MSEIQRLRQLAGIRIVESVEELDEAGYDHVGFIKSVISDVHPHTMEKDKLMDFVGKETGYISNPDFPAWFDQAYSSFYGLDLDDEELDDQESEPQICTTCNGSGEGQYDGTRCRSCGGSGVESTRSEDDMDEGYTVLPDMDRERYTDMSGEGLEGPFTMKTGKVVYYDPQEGKYYDRDTDMYLSQEDYDAHNIEETNNTMPNVLTPDAINPIMTMDMDAARNRTMELINSSTTKPEKKQYLLKQAAESFTNRQLAKILYDMLLAGEGLAVQGSTYSKKFKEEAVAEDLNNGYDSVKELDGEDYFPDGADSPVTDRVGPSGARQGDNPEQKKAAIDEAHAEIVHAYRKFIKEGK